jgi:hypothetical protein
MEREGAAGDSQHDGRVLHISDQLQRRVDEAVDMVVSWVKKTVRRLPLSLPPAPSFPAYRAFWMGLLASLSGFQMLRFGQYRLIYRLTGSPLALG